MGRKARWFGAVKKVFGHESKKKNGRKPKQSDTSTSDSFEKDAAPPPAALPHPEVVKLAEAEHEPSNQIHPVSISTPAAAESAAEVVRHTTSAKLSEEAAAVKIQTAYRGYLARRALRALRGLGRLKSLIHGNSVMRQATTTLRCMQTLARVQSQIRWRRIRMLEENQALQRQLLLKRERELENLSMGDEWDDSLQTKDQIEASMLSKHEAAIRRERALAYAFSHQWKNSSRAANPLFMDANNPHWGWSWMERWMAARPWESRSTTDNNDRASVKSTGRSIGGEITGAYVRRETNADKPSPTAQKPVRPPSRQSPSTPPSKAPSVAGKVVRSASPRSGWGTLDDDTRSMVSMQSERHRRHSIAGSSVRDDESLVSLASSPAVPSYMAPTQAAKARSRFQSASVETTPDKGSVGSVKKRLSFPVGEKHSVVASPAGVRRHSGPPKIDVAFVRDIAIAAPL